MKVQCVKYNEKNMAALFMKRESATGLLKNKTH